MTMSIDLLWSRLRLSPPTIPSTPLKTKGNWLWPLTARIEVLEQRTEHAWNQNENKCSQPHSTTVRQDAFASSAVDPPALRTRSYQELIQDLDTTC